MRRFIGTVDGRLRLTDTSPVVVKVWSSGLPEPLKTQGFLEWDDAKTFVTAENNKEDDRHLTVEFRSKNGDVTDNMILRKHKNYWP